MSIFNRKNKIDAFGLLLDLSSYSIDAANTMEDKLINFDHSKMADWLVEMHEIEHTADLMLHDLIHKLAHNETRDISRTDVGEIANYIDEVTDAIEEVFMRFHMFNIQKLRSEAIEFTQLISRATVKMADMINEFRNYKTSLRVRESIVDINSIEEEGDQLYARSVRRLYTESNDPIEIIAWTEIFYFMEDCCDRIEDVAEQVEGVIIKNT